MKASVKNALRVVIGLVVGMLLVIIIPLLVLASGVMDFSASKEAGAIESTLAPWAYERSMARRAPDGKNPFVADANALAVGMDHYRENCVICHGAPDVKPVELAEGLNPAAPKLHTDDSQELKDGEIFYIVKNGIRMTGMPAFGPTHSDEEIWKIVAFVRHLPKLTPPEKNELQAKIAEEAKRHHEGAEQESREAAPHHEATPEHEVHAPRTTSPTQTLHPH